MNDSQSLPTRGPSRRTFLKTAAASVFASGIAPAILGAQDKAESRKPIVGEGEFTYELTHNWGELPAGVQWLNTHGVTVDKNGLIYVIHQGPTGGTMDTVVVFDADGKCVRSFGSEFCGGGHGIDLREEDGTEFLYISDITHGQVVKCDTRGEWVWKLRYPRQPNLYRDVSRFKPTNVAFAPDGGFYIGDGYGSSYIHQYDKNAGYVRSWGGAGNQPGQLRTPHGLWVDNRPGRAPALCVADRNNFRLQYFSLDGEHQSLYTETLFPANIDIRGEVMLVTDLYARLILLNAKNEVITYLAYDPEWSKAVSPGPPRPYYETPDRWPVGKFVYPHDGCFDGAGNIIVPEYVKIGRLNFLRKV